MLADAAVVMALRRPQLLATVVDEARGAGLPIALPSALRPCELHLVRQLLRLAKPLFLAPFCPETQGLRALKAL